jgi:hypothetical protein
MRIANEGQGYIDFYYARTDGTLWGVRMRQASCHATESETGAYEDVKACEKEFTLPILTDPEKPDWIPRVLLVRVEYMARYPESDLAALMDLQRDFVDALRVANPH